VQEVAHKLIALGLPAVPVVNDQLEVLGMAPEHAILEAIGKGMDLEQLTAEQIMITTPLIADINTSAEELITMLLKNRCCSVVAIMKDRRYAGVVSRHMLVDLYTSPAFARYTQKENKGPFVCL